MKPANILSPTLCPQRLLPWLTHQHSLTKMLKMKTGDAQVQLIKQAWVAISWWDRYVLGLNKEKVFKREIIMTSHKKACWYARTIIPQASFALEPSFFARLEHEPLTALIFDESRVKRQQLLHYPIAADCLEFYWIKPSLLTTQTWARFSSFVFLEKEMFYLIEILLPD